MAELDQSVHLIRQQIAAGNQFTASTPTGDPSLGKTGMASWSDLSTGGRITLPRGGYHNVRRIAADFADAVTWSIALRHRNADGTWVDYPLFTDADFEDAGGQLLVSGDSVVIVASELGEELVVETTGATEAMRVDVLFSRW
jgi:hypothetical protein